MGSRLKKVHFIQMTYLSKIQIPKGGSIYTRIKELWGEVKPGRLGTINIKPFFHIYIHANRTKIMQLSFKQILSRYLNYKVTVIYTKTSELRSCVKVEVDVLGSRP